MSEYRFDTFRGVQQALRNRDLEQTLYKVGGVVMDDVMLTLHGEAHQQRRRIAVKVFERGFFRYYEKEVFPATLAHTLEPYLAIGKADLLDCGYRVTMNLTADFAGIDRPERSANETRSLLELVRTFSETATLAHSTRPHAEVIAEAREALAHFESHFVTPSRQRREQLLAQCARGDIAESELPRDILTVLLQHQSELQLDDTVLLRELAFYMQAGAHSTANSTIHAMHHLFDWIAVHPLSRAELISDPLLIQRFVHESFRLHPASPVAQRGVTCPTVIRDCPALHSGDTVVADLHAANRDQTIFGDDAEQFNPFRTLPRDVMPYGLTFGYGMHACMGKDLDGGLVVSDQSRAEHHQYGIVSLFVQALLAHGARRDPTDPPTQDPNTQRQNWGRYPVLFGSDKENGVS